MGRRKGNSQGGGSGHSEAAEQAERLRSVCGAELKGISAAKVQAALAEADGDLQEAIRMLLGSSGRPNESELLDQALAKLARAGGAGGAAAQASSSGKRGRRDGGRRRSDNGGRGGNKDPHAAGAGDSNASASSEEETADNNSNNGSSGTAEPKKHLRTSEDVFHRLKWDPDYDNGDFIVGYMDRFDGMKESEFALWVERDVTAETFIPWHRVYYFQRKSDGVRVWDRESRTDLVFEGAAEVDSDAGVARDPTGAAAVAASPSPPSPKEEAGEGEVSSGTSANGESSRAGALAPSDANDDDQVAHGERDQRAGATAATFASQRKVVTSAVVVSPPEEMWDVINEIRQKHDRAYPRWMPHISMAYPFVPEEEFETARAALEDELQNSTPFTVTLADFGFFEHGKGGTVWLDPRVQEGVTGRDLHDLQAALARAVPHCNNVAEHAGGFHPHLSVAQAPKAQLGDQANKFQKGWAALKFEVKEVCMIARGKTGSEEDEFRVVHRVPLGGSADKQAFSKAEAALAAASGSSSAGGNAAPAGSRSGGGNRGRGGRGGRGGNHQRDGGPANRRGGGAGPGGRPLQEMVPPLAFNEERGKGWEERVFKPQGTPAPDTLRVLTWNVLFDLHERDDELRTADRWPQLFAELARLDADVVALQECTGKFVRKLAKDEGIQQRYVLSDVSGSTLVRYGQVLLIKREHPVSAFWQHREGKRGKSTLFGELRWEDGEALLIPVLHLTSDHAENAATKRRHQLSSMVYSRTDLSNNVLLLGDVNFGDGDENDDAHWSDHGFVDAWHQLRSGEDGFTFDPADNPLAEICSKTGKKRRFDRVMCKKTAMWEPIDICLVGTEAVSVPDKDPVFLSDHYGVLCTLRKRK